jgi:hypothetical protein
MVGYETQADCGSNYVACLEFLPLDMVPQFRNPPSAKYEYEARRGKAFLDSIGADALGLGPMSYVMGGLPDAAQARKQFDKALDGLAAGMAGTRQDVARRRRGSRRKWRLADDNSDPTTLVSPLFEPDQARKLEAKRRGADEDGIARRL